jgi:hypothetical protein
MPHTPHESLNRLRAPFNRRVLLLAGCLTNEPTLERLREYGKRN